MENLVYHARKMVEESNMGDDAKMEVLDFLNLDDILALKEYRKLEEKGMLIKLPCPIGTKVYCIGEEFELPFGDDAVNYVLREESFDLYMLKAYGDNIFFTREEAIAKLKELNNVTKKYCVTVTRTGCLFIEAHSAEEAMDIANHQATDTVSWSEDWTPSVCEKDDSAGAYITERAFETEGVKRTIRSEDIKARFASAAENQTDELDFYMELLDIGIDVNMVRHHMGDETAKHMQKFCEEHGLLDSEPDTVCISLSCLYHSNHQHLHYGGEIVRTTEDGNEFYDLHKDGPEHQVLLCDGEEVRVIAKTEDRILVENPDTDCKVWLTQEEFGIATFGVEV